jgi:hypothetical protein
MSLFYRASLAAVLVTGTSSAFSAVDFEKQILPFMKERCFDCHQAPTVVDGRKKEPKAGLRLDSPSMILKGSENGPVLKPKESAKSSLYEVVTLPADDDAHMPPKGDPLTAEQIKHLKEWIDEGASFGTWTGTDAPGKPADAFTQAKPAAGPREHEELYKKLTAAVKPLDEAVLKKAQEAGAQVFQLKADSGLVRIDFLTGVTKCTDEKIAALLPIKDNIAQLDLGRTKITDAALATIAQFPHLVSLDLRQTAVGDAGMEHLAKLKYLQTLNIFGTAVTDAGLKHLAAIKSLKSVSAWQSKATKAGAQALGTAAPGMKIVIE